MRDLHTLDKYRDRDFERQYYGCNGDAKAAENLCVMEGKM